MNVVSMPVRKTKEKKSVNKPSDMMVDVHVVSPDVGGCHTIRLTIPEAEFFNADPDAWACVFLNIDSVSDYREWCDCHGVAMCSAVTKRGKPCGHPAILPERLSHVFGGLPFALWRELHRNSLCGIHAKKGE